MLENQKLNNLAVLARKKCPQAIEELCRHYTPLINSITARYQNSLSDEAGFECSSVRMIRVAIKHFKEEKGDFDSIVRSNLSRLTKRYLAKGKKRTDRLFFSDSAVTSENGEDDYHNDIPDLVEDVESSLIAKEIAAMLAQGDQRKMFILKNWMDGNTNDKKVSEMLAHLFGGSPNYQRVYVQRFRAKCKSILMESGYSL